jgi:hypothetical protein
MQKNRIAEFRVLHWTYEWEAIRTYTVSLLICTVEHALTLTASVLSMPDYKPIFIAPVVVNFIFFCWPFCLLCCVPRVKRNFPEGIKILAKCYAWTTIILSYTGIVVIISVPLIVLIFQIQPLANTFSEKGFIETFRTTFMITLCLLCANIQLGNNILRALETMSTQNYFQPGFAPSLVDERAHENQHA